MKPFRLSSTAGVRTSQVVKLIDGTTRGVDAPDTNV